MGRFRIGQPSGDKKELLKSKPARQVLQNIIEKADTSKIEEAISNLESKISNMKPVVMPEKVIEKVETIKELVSINTKDLRLRKYAKSLKRMIHIQTLRNDVQDERNDGQDAEIIKQKEIISALKNEIIKLQEDSKDLESEILEEIQLLKSKNNDKLIMLGLMLSIGLSLFGLYLKI